MRRFRWVAVVVVLLLACLPAPPAVAAAPTPADAVSTAARNAAARGVTSFISVVDRGSGAVLARTANDGAQVASESIMKLFIATYYLLLYGGHASTPQAEKDRLSFMLRYSDNDTASSMFTTSAIPTVAARYGLGSTTNATDRPGHWGAARITAADMTRFLFRAAKDPAVGPWLIPVMAQTAPTGSGEDAGFNQAFGLNALTGVHGSKQGWGCDSFWTIPRCAVHSVGYTDRYFVAVLQLSSGYPDPMRATATDTARAIQGSVPGRVPMGSLDRVSVTGQTVRLQGWAFDPDQPATEISVAVYDNGRGIRWYPTGGSRPDVNRIFGITGDHGFNITLTLPWGRHDLRIHGINVAGGSGNPVIATRTLTLGATPRSHLDRLTPGPNGTIRATGWAFDPDQPTTAISVHVYRDGVGARSATTTVSRPDVNRAFGITGTHGFDVSIPATPGDHTVKVYAINVGGGSGNPLVGTGPVRVGIARGTLDSASQSGSRTVRLRGWAFDPDAPAVAIKVAVYRDGALVGWFPTGLSRSDVNRVYGITGNHGFDVRVPAAPGARQFRLFAINTGPAAQNPHIGSATVEVTR